MDNSVWVPMLLALLYTSNSYDYNILNHLNGYRKYERYGVDA